MFAAANGKSGAAEVTAERRTVVQEVTVSGKVTPVQSVDLAFEKTGRVAAVLVKVGSKIQAGSRLATVESSELAANLLKAKASLTAEIAKLAEMRAGTRPEEISVYEAKALNAEFAFSDAKKNLEDKLVDAFTKSDDAIRGTVDQFMTSGGGGSPQLNFVVSDGQIEAAVEQGRAATEVVLDAWAVLSMDTSVAVGESAIIATVQGNLGKVQVFLNKVAVAVNALSPSTSLFQATIDGYRSDVSTARTNVNTAIVNLSAAVEKWNSAETSLAIAKKELDLKRAGSTPEAIASEEAKVDEQRAEVASIEAQLAKHTLIAPIRGTVTFFEVKPGEVVSSGVKVASVISEDALEIEAYVSEVSVGKVAIGNPARVTLDAFPGEEFAGRITYLEPAETLIDGVVNFKVKAAFDALDPRLLSGLTANVYIETARRENVIAIPRYAITERDGKFFAMVRSADGNVAEREILLGLQGIDGFQEVLSGLEVGDTVVIEKK